MKVTSFSGSAGSSASSSISTSISLDPEQLNDRQLFERCQHFGGLALKARRHFIGLLPLVEKRRLYERHGDFYSVYDFAAMIGGIGKEIVTEVLRLDIQLKNFQLVRKLLYSGKVSWSKIRMVMHWLTIDDQEAWIQKLENMSVRALTVYVRDFAAQLHQESQSSITEIISPSMPHIKQNATEQNNIILSSENLKNLFQNKAENFGAEISEYSRIFSKNQISGDISNAINNGIHAEQQGVAPSAEPSKFAMLSHFRETITFSLRSDLAAKLRLFRQQLERTRKEMITWEEVMDEFLKMVEQTGVEQKAGQTSQTGMPSSAAKLATRHIPNATKREVLGRFGGLCAFRDCAKPAEILHHTRRFALSMSTPAPTIAEVHDPRYIQPLCKAHERIIHATLVANEEIDPSTWKLLRAPDTTSERYMIDHSVNSFRKPK